MSRIARARELIGHRLVKNTVALFIVQMSAYVAPLAVLPYLSRVLSTEHYGLIAFATSFNWYFMTLVDYGFNLTATRRAAISQDDPKKLSELFSSVMSAKIVLTIVGFAMMTGIVFATPKLRPNFPLFCISYLLVLGDLLFPLWLFQGLQKMENLLWRDLGGKMLSLCLIFAFVRHDRDYLWAAAFQSSSMVIAGILGMWTVFRLTPARWVTPTRKEVIHVLVEGWPVFLSVAATTLTSSTNIFILGLCSSPSDVAYYSIPFRVVIAIRSLISPAVTAIYPYISRMASKSRDNAILFLRNSAWMVATPFFAGSLILFLAAVPIIHLFGAKYTASIPILRILAFSPALLALQHIYSTFYMLAFGYEREWSRIILRTTILNFMILVPLLMIMWHPAAVAVTSMCLEVFVMVSTYLFYRKTARVMRPTIAA